MEHRWSIDICLCSVSDWQTVRPCLSSASPGSFQLFPLSNKIAIHFLYKSPEHLFGLVMGDQLSHCFPYEVANNLLGGPRYPWDCKSIWTRGRKRETRNLYPPDEGCNSPSGAQVCMKTTCGASMLATSVSCPNDFSDKLSVGFSVPLLVMKREPFTFCFTHLKWDTSCVASSITLRKCRQQIAACSQTVPALPLLSHSLKVSWHQKSSSWLGISLPGKRANFAYHTPFSLQGITMMSSKETGTPGSQLSHWGDLLNISGRQCWA